MSTLIKLAIAAVSATVIVACKSKYVTSRVTSDKAIAALSTVKGVAIFVTTAMVVNAAICEADKAFPDLTPAEIAAMD